MLDQLEVQQQQPRPGDSLGDKALRWSWLLFLLSWPWHLIGGGIAIWLTSLEGGDFTEGTGVPRYVYLLLYARMITPLVASFVVGLLGTVKWRRPAAIVPALLSAAMVAVVTVFGAEEFFG